MNATHELVLCNGTTTTTRGTHPPAAVVWNTRASRVRPSRWASRFWCAVFCRARFVAAVVTREAEDCEANACEAVVDAAGVRRPLEAALRDDLVECLDLNDLFCWGGADEVRDGVEEEGIVLTCLSVGR